MDALKIATGLAQECVGQSPVILLGSGASAAHGIPGMWRLGEHLMNSTLPMGLTKADTDSWGAFCELLPSTDLESALTQVTLTPTVTEHVVSSTWDFLNPYDLNVFESVSADRKYLPLTRLFEHLFRSTTREIEVVTPNYDRIAEMAAEAGGYTAYTGFTFGSLALRAAAPAPKIYYGKVAARTVNIWKVHGSFGWFADGNGVVVGLPPMRTRPSAMEPIIVTPGIEKYRRTHDEPFRTTMHRADTAMGSASSFLCIGYGFNDQHLQPWLVERCYAKSIPLVLITRGISEKAHAFFKSGKCQRYMALEQAGDATKLFSNEFPDGVDLPDSCYWELNEFLTLVM